MTSLPEAEKTESHLGSAAPAEAPCILSIAFPYAPTGEGAVGGAEVILSQIEAALPSLGFRSVVVAHAASQPQGQLYATAVPPGEITDSLRNKVEAAQQRAIDQALAEQPVALVHMHGLDFQRYRIPAHLPVLVTLHLPPTWYPESLWALPANYHFVCVSETQRRACPEAVRNRLEVVPNGVPLPAESNLRPAGRYALMLARICAEKNLHTGLDAARLAGMPAMLAGEVFPYESHQRYFTKEIEPRLTRTGNTHEQRLSDSTSPAEARFLGPVTGAAKSRLIARAACLLLPSLAPETSSLVAMEALAAGVPVIAMASGAVPEIVEEGRTGFLLDPQLGAGDAAARAMAEAISRLAEIDRRVCRAVAEERFGLSRVLEAYGDLYRRYMLTQPVANLLREVDDPAQPTGAYEVGVQLSPVTHLTADQELIALAPEWRRLWENDSVATPFQHPAWLLPWWRQFGPDGELHSLVLRSVPGELLGLLPLYVYRPLNGKRQLLMLGAGTSDYLNGLFSSSHEPARLAKLTLETVLEQLRCWDILSLMQLPAESPLLRAAETPSMQQWTTVTEAESCAVVDVRRELPAKVRANARRYRRRAETQGPLNVSVAASADEALESFTHLERLHRDRWNAGDEVGVLSDERVQAHHREAIPALFEADLLRMFRLTLSDEVIGVLYALADPPGRPRRCLYLYLIGFDLHLSDLSPGTLLLHEVWQYARARGFAHLDLLRGGESYKQLWGAQPEPTFALQAVRPTG